MFRNNLQTPYNFIKCVALTSSQQSEEEREKRKIKIGHDLDFHSWPDPRHVFTTSYFLIHLHMYCTYVFQFMLRNTGVT